MTKQSFVLKCPRCTSMMDTRNARTAFCSECAAIVDQVTGAAYDSAGVFITNVIAEMLSREPSRYNTVKAANSGPMTQSV